MDVRGLTYFLHFDANGHEKDWIGSKEDAQKIIEVEKAKRLSAIRSEIKKNVGLVDNFGSSTKKSYGISPEINRVNDCVWPNSFLDFWNNGPLVCFANSGSSGVTIYAVYQVDSGNNTGSFTANQGPASTSPFGSGWVCLANPIRFSKSQTLYPPQNDVWTITGINVS